MSAPDVIYLQWYGDGDPEWDNEEPECADVTWAVECVYDSDIVYRRERMCAWTQDDDDHGIKWYLSPHGERAPEDQIRDWPYCRGCGGRIEVTK